MKENELEGIIPAACSVITHEKKLNVDKTVDWAENLLTEGQANFVCLLGSTGCGQLISPEEKRSLILRCGKSKLRERMIWGTGSNSLAENQSLLKLALQNSMPYSLLMGSAYFSYKEDGAYKWFAELIKELNEARIVLYNFQALSGFKMTLDLVKRLENDFPAIHAIKDSTGNIFNTLALKRLKIFPGSETKLLEGLQKYKISGIISALGNIFSKESSQVFNAWKKGKILSNENNKLVSFRRCIEQYPLVSAVHTILSKNNSDFSNLIPPLELLDEKNKTKLFGDLEKLNFNMAA